MLKYATKMYWIGKIDLVAKMEKAAMLGVPQHPSPFSVEQGRQDRDRERMEEVQETAPPN